MLLTDLEIQNAELDRRREITWLNVTDYSKVRRYNVNYYDYS